VRAWSERHVKDRQYPLYYMFSGPDFLYANAFFSSASSYLMSGLEPVGAVPTVSERTVASLPRIQEMAFRWAAFAPRPVRSRVPATG
jgi:hypothetical protein